jgi:hypothetical protein
MTGADDRLRSGRFGAASPGLRPERQSLEDLLTARQRPPARRRRTLLVVLCIAAVLAAGGGGYLAGRFTAPAPAPPSLTQILVTDAALPQGARISAADLFVITVRRGISTPPGSLGPAAEPSLLGLATTTALPSETIVTRSLLAPAASVPLAASALVGLALKPGQLPAGGLTEGEQVLIAVVPSSNAPAFSLVTSTVWDVQGSAAAGMVTATVIVPASIATRLAGYAARGEVALVVTGAAATSAAAPIRHRPKPKAHPSIPISPSTSPSTKPTTKPKPKPSSKPSAKPSTTPSHHS